MKERDAKAVLYIGAVMLCTPIFAILVITSYYGLDGQKESYIGLFLFSFIYALFYMLWRTATDKNMNPKERQKLAETGLVSGRYPVYVLSSILFLILVLLARALRGHPLPPNVTWGCLAVCSASIALGLIVVEAARRKVLRIPMVWRGSPLPELEFD